MARPQTDADIAALEAGHSLRHYFVALGLSIAVAPSGHRYFSVHWRGAGRTHSRKIGTWPVMDLAAARAEAQRLHAALRGGSPPATRTPEEAQALRRQTLATPARLYKNPAAPDSSIIARVTRQNEAFQRLALAWPAPATGSM